MSTPYLPDCEPTEAAVCRMSLAKMQQLLIEMRRQTPEDHAAWERMKTEADAWAACLRKAGWDREPQEEQHIWSAG